MRGLKLQMSILGGTVNYRAVCPPIRIIMSLNPNLILCGLNTILEGTNLQMSEDCMLDDDS